jgi:long-chain acyl-CoA synthetase
MHPYVHAGANPDKPAVIVAETGAVLTYAQLDEGSNQAAQFFRSRGLGVDSVIAIMMENHLDYYKLTWGAQRAGLRYVCISSRLTADETDYILENSGAKLFIVSASLSGTTSQLATQVERYAHGGELPGYGCWEETVAAMPTSRIADERAGVDMLYSSGTTGRPKGVRVPLPEDPAIDVTNSLVMVAQALYRFSADSVYLSPAPLYHAAPLRWSMTVHKLGGTVVIMKKFDAEGVLQHIEKYKVTCGQYVPTHFIRMLKLPEDVRSRYDLSSNDCAIHAAAPCPVPVKEAMIAWWGPIIEEYYAGSEGNGMTMINSADWLTHKGSVGKARSPALSTSWRMMAKPNCRRAAKAPFSFENPDSNFEYHGDPEKTQSSRNSKGWSTLGDVGYLDPEGLSVPHRPQELHDHFGWREHLSAGNRKPSRHPPAECRTWP